MSWPLAPLIGRIAEVERRMRDLEYWIEMKLAGDLSDLQLALDRAQDDDKTKGLLTGLFDPLWTGGGVDTGVGSGPPPAQPCTDSYIATLMNSASITDNYGTHTLAPYGVNAWHVHYFIGAVSTSYDWYVNYKGSGNLDVTLQTTAAGNTNSYITHIINGGGCSAILNSTVYPITGASGISHFSLSSTAH